MNKSNNSGFEERTRELIARFKVDSDYDMGDDSMIAATTMETLLEQRSALLSAARKALTEMCNTISPRDGFTEAVDELDAAITRANC